MMPGKTERPSGASALTIDPVGSRPHDADVRGADAALGLDPTNAKKKHRGLTADRVGAIALRIGVVVIVLVLWQVMSGRLLPAYTVSRPTSIVAAFVSYISTAAAWVDIRTTTEEYLLGLALGTAMGLFVAMLLASVKLFGRAFEPIVAALNAVPVPALAPLFIILFGIGVTSKVVIAVIAVFFVMFYNTYVAILNVPDPLLNTLKTFGAGRWAQLRYAILPSVAPEMFAGLRISVGLSMVAVLIGEFLAAIEGVGHYIDQQTQLFNSGNTFAGIIVAVLIVLFFRALLILLERRVLRWRRISAA